VRKLTHGNPNRCDCCGGGGLRSQNGVTLVELVAVIAILGLILALALPRYLTAKKRAYLPEAYAILQEIKGLEMSWYMEHGNCFQPNLAVLGFVMPGGSHWQVAGTGPSGEGGNGGPCDQNSNGKGFQGGNKGNGNAPGRVLITMGGAKTPLAPSDQITLQLNGDGSSSMTKTL
jgi:prepilin-type N-terminal cleavage/methylation domain-containing protein